MKQERDLDGSALNGSTTDFSTDALLSKQRSTIQWIGAPPSSAAAAALSVPSLLRQLYASRESVIRANVHANRTSGYFNGTGTGGGGGGGSENLSVSATGVGSVDYPSVHDVFPPTSSYSASAGFLPAEYLPAMTPPSSVSPRDAAAGALFAAEASLRHSYSIGDSSAYKPHVYGVHGIDHSGASGQYAPQSALPLAETGQFYPHAASGFHLYHPQVTKSSNNASAWYPNWFYYSSAFRIRRDYRFIPHSFSPSWLFQVRLFLSSFQLFFFSVTFGCSGIPIIRSFPPLSPPRPPPNPIRRKALD